MNEMAEIMSLLRNQREEIESLRKNLLDPGGQLDRNASAHSQNLAIFRSDVDRKFGMILDEINNIKMRTGVLEVGDSEHKIKASVPFTCLIVDDDTDVRRIIERVLNSAGISTLQADSGQAALDLLESTRPIDVVLTDLLMPQNGAGLVAHVRKSHPRVEIVIMTGYDGGAASKALEAGAHAYLPKPFPSNDALVLAVMRAAEHRRARTSAAERP